MLDNLSLLGYALCPLHSILTWSMCACVCSFWAMPGFLLKRQILLNLPCDNLEGYIADSIDFMVERVRLCVVYLSYKCNYSIWNVSPLFCE